MKNYRLQPRRGSDCTDRYYSTLAAAKGQLTRLARKYRNYSYVVVERSTGHIYEYNAYQAKVIRSPTQGYAPEDP